MKNTLQHLEVVAEGFLIILTLALATPILVLVELVSAVRGKTLDDESRVGGGGE